jgi:hypothetical protein
MADQPIVCDMSTAKDTEEERLAEYRRLFASALTGRDRVGDAIRFRFRADAEEWVRDLAAREKACCAFYDFTIAVEGAEVWWDCTAPADARPVLDEFHALPDMLAADPDLTAAALMASVARR